MTTIRAPIRPLTRVQRKIAEQLIRGLSPADIALCNHLSRPAVDQQIRILCARVDLRWPCPQHLLVHALIASGRMPRPAPRRPAPDITPSQMELLRALAQHEHPSKIARGAGIARTEVRERTRSLVEHAEATGLTHLIILAHAWQWLDEEPATASAGAGQ